MPESERLRDAPFETRGDGANDKYTLELRCCAIHIGSALFLTAYRTGGTICGVST